MYIIGPVRGLPKDEVKSNFEKAEKLAIDLGYIPFNPLKIVPLWLTDLEDQVTGARRVILDLLTSKLLHSHAVLIQYDSEKSSGARIEMKIAEEEKIPTFYLDSTNSKVHFIQKYEHRDKSAVED